VTALRKRLSENNEINVEPWTAFVPVGVVKYGDDCGTKALCGGEM
jgi:hypothetical protein